MQILKTQRDPTLRPEYKGVFDCARKVYTQFGLRGCYQGLTATILRNSPANGLYFGTYEAMRAWLASTNSTTAATTTTATTAPVSLPVSKVLLAGGCGGMAYWLFTYPLDVIKSAMQTDRIDPTQRRFRSVWDTARQLYAEGGVRRFTRGLSPCLARAVPANATLFLVVEQVRDFVFVLLCCIVIFRRCRGLFVLWASSPLV